MDSTTPTRGTDGEQTEFEKNVEILERVGAILPPLYRSQDLCNCDECREYNEEGKKTYLSDAAIRILEMREKLGDGLTYFFRIDRVDSGF